RVAVGAGLHEGRPGTEERHRVPPSRVGEDTVGQPAPEEPDRLRADRRGTHDPAAAPSSLTVSTCPETTSSTRSEAAAMRWLSRPSRSAKTRPERWAGTTPHPTSFVTAT